MAKGAKSDSTAPVTPPSKNNSVPALVLIGLSAGGMEALYSLLDAIPHDFKFTIVVMLHLHPDYKSVLASLLAQRTGLRVEAAADGKLMPGIVYVAPPDQHLTFKDGSIKLLRTAPVHHHRPSIDVMFESAAMDESLRIVAVLLSGADNDGASGISAIKAVGGTTIAQSPETAQFRSMPNAAIATGCVDFVLPSRKIGEVLEKLTTAANG
jgi:two-component system chemotaxis response regulator CheB